MLKHMVPMVIRGNPKELGIPTKILIAHQHPIL